MPTLDAYVNDTLGHILVETTWGDVPAAESVQVRRVHADGTRYPLRTYVWPDAAAGEYQHLSGGWAGFWDTEAPLDQAFSYEADAVDVSGAIIQSPIRDLVALDTFGRTTSPGWGSTESPVVPWTQSGLGAAADYFTNGAQGVMRFTIAASQNRGMLLDPVAVTNGEFRVLLKSNVLQTGGNGNWSVKMRRNAGTNSFYEWRLFLVNGANITGNIGRNLNGVSSSITGFTAVPGVATNDQPVWLYGSIQGYRIRMKAWLDGLTEPSAFMYDFTDTVTGVTGPGDFEIVYSTPGSVTTATPFDMFVDNLLVRSFDPVSAPTVVTAGPYTLASNGGFWLRDPLRPCNDRRVELCFDPADPACVPGAGIFFADMTTETYAANAAKFLPTNAKLPIAIARQRRDADSALTLVTRTFTDRDNVLATAEPGSPLQWVAPPGYGIPDRYMSVDAVQVSRGVPDVTFAPRLIQLPFSTVDRPVGSSQGVCGLRFMDLCDTYATWDLAAASGLSYATLVTGTPASLGFRTWAAVNATWASWAAVLAAEPTWQQVLVP